MEHFRPITAAIAVAVLLTGITEGPLTGAAFAQSAGQAGEEATFGVGDTLSASEVHIITSPGRYGLGPAPDGSRYAVADGKLIRVDPNTLKVQSILRSQSEVLD